MSPDQRRSVPRSWAFQRTTEFTSQAAGQDHCRTHRLTKLPGPARGLGAAPTRLGVPPPRGRLPAEQLVRKLLARSSDSTPSWPWVFRAPAPRPRALALRPRPRRHAPAALALRPRPPPEQQLPSWPESGARGAQVPREGSGGGFGKRPLPGLPHNRRESHPARGRRASDSAARQETAPALPAAAGRSRAGREVALPVPARRVGRPRVFGVTSARAPGACVSGRSRSGWTRALCAPERRRRRAPHGREPGERRPLREPPRGSARSGPRPPGAGRVRAGSPGWAPWRCPGAGHPRGAHRLNPGGPAAGRRPQVHGGFGAR